MLEDAGITGFESGKTVDGVPIHFYNEETNTVFLVMQKQYLNFDTRTLNHEGMLQVRVLESLPSKPTIKWVSENNYNPKKPSIYKDKLRFMLGSKGTSKSE